MRLTRLIGGVALMFAMGLTAHAQVTAGGTVVTTAVEVRSGPSEKYYATGKLQVGDSVQVMDEKLIPWLGTKPPPAGWLAIKPPPGSFSWINKRFLDINGRYAAVHGQAPVPIRIGSTVYDGKPDVKQADLPPGYSVVIVGKEQTDKDEGIWVPIEPGPLEVRYIPADAVKLTPPVQTISSAPPPLAPAEKPAASAAPAPAVRNDPPEWLQADAAMRQGRLDEAEKLYQQMAQQAMGKDHDLWVRCHNRIAFIQDERKRLAAAATAQAPPPPAYPPPGQAYPPTYPPPGQAYPSSPATSPNTVPGRATSQYTYIREPAAPSAGQPPMTTANATSGFAPANANPAAAFAPRWTEPGWLVKTAVPIEGKQAFRLELSGGQFVYATAQPGVDLTSYVNRRVQLYGTMIYRTGERCYHMTVAQAVAQP
jgi:hypothetical protein